MLSSIARYKQHQRLPLRGPVYVKNHTLNIGDIIGNVNDNAYNVYLMFMMYMSCIPCQVEIIKNQGKKYMYHIF